MTASVLDRADPVTVLVVMSVIAMAFRLFPLFLQRRQLVRFVADDGYMYFQIVRNMAAGRGATFDGVTKTNGFHPMYPLLLTPVFRYFRDNEDNAIRVAIVMLGVFNVATVAFVYLIVSWLFGPWPAVFASAVWLFNPWVLYTTVEGLEAPIWVFFAGATSALWLWMKLHGHAGGLEYTVALGSLIGLAFWARSEAILLAPAIFIDMAITLHHHGAGFVGSRLAVFTAVTLAVYSPWLGWCWRNFGRITQVSGEILTYKHHADIMDRLSLKGLAKTAAVAGLNLAYAFDKFLRFALGDRGLTIALAAFAGGIAASGLVDLSIVRGTSNIAFLALFLGIHMLFYGGFFWRFQDWYFLSAAFAAAVFAGVGARVLQQVNVGADVNGLVVAGSMVVLAFAVITVWLARKDRRSIDQPQRALYEAAEWIKQNTSEDTVVATVNTGIIAFFSGRTVLNLSGAVNNPAAEAIHGRRLLHYLQGSGAQYFVDFDSAIDYFGKYWGENPRPHLRTVEHLNGTFRGGSMKVFEVLKPSETTVAARN